MKRKIALVGLSLFISCVHAQIIKTVNLDSNFNIAADSTAGIKRFIYKNGDSFKIIDTYENDSTAMIGYYSSIEPMIENGDFKFFTQNGKLLSEGKYVNGELAGVWINYDSNGAIEREIEYNLINLKTNKKLIDYQRAFEYNKKYVVESNKPAGDNAINSFREYIATNIQYPAMSARTNKTGKVYITFTVNKYGYVCKVKAIGECDKDLQAEAKRVVLASPQWSPPKQGNKTVNQVFTVPLVFKLEE